MILFALALLQVAPEIVVIAPPKATPQTPATIVVEPAAMFAAACDASADALVTRVELADCVANSFAAADTEKSGSLRYLAYSDWALRWLGDRTALPGPYDADRNADNMITLAELVGQFAKLFSRWDADRDGELTRAELLTFKTRPIDANGPTSVRPGEKPGRKPR